MNKLLPGIRDLFNPVFGQRMDQMTLRPKESGFLWQKWPFSDLASRQRKNIHAILSHFSFRQSRLLL